MSKKKIDPNFEPPLRNEAENDREREELQQLLKDRGTTIEAEIARIKRDQVHIDLRDSPTDKA